MSIFKFLFILCLPELVLVGFFIIKGTRVALLLSPTLLRKGKETIEKHGISRRKKLLGVKRLNVQLRCLKTVPDSKVPIG